MAGSYALSKFQRECAQENENKWTPSDIDVFVIVKPYSTDEQKFDHLTKIGLWFQTHMLREKQGRFGPSANACERCVEQTSTSVQ